MLKYVMKMALAVGLAVLWAGSAQAQQTYRSGQHVEPAYEGWEQLEDGSYNFIFGYHNENWEERLLIPVGNDNYFEPGPPDRGQPTFFLPRRNRFTFTVNVPEDWGDQELVWTVTSPNGETRKAYASLERDYVIDNIVIQSETGALGAGTSTPESRANEPPELTLLGEQTRTARVNEPITLQARVEDDGLLDTRTGPDERTPESEMERIMEPPSQVTVGKTNGLFLSWNVYRGDGSAVEFSPPQVKVWEDTRASANSPWGELWTPPPVPEDGEYETTVTFKEEGTYVLWGRADDGGLFDDQYVTVFVE